jgi:hypothetical protein
MPVKVRVWSLSMMPSCGDASRMLFINMLTNSVSNWRETSLIALSGEAPASERSFCKARGSSAIPDVLGPRSDCTPRGSRARAAVFVVVAMIR